jgi:hypothetical protein
MSGASVGRARRRIRLAVMASIPGHAAQRSVADR